MPSVGFTDLNYDSSDDSIRRLTDDYGRHRLTDVLEEENEDEGFGHYSYFRNRKRYSSIGSAASSMDALWDLHPRRLSEAGLSRHSDSSAVLTEDTDSFIIGQRVWVSGSKPGHIAYIGETQFAPGDWAGIALDEPIGKNDGSVGGIRYFQCEPKKGVFARLTRLTRFPLAQEGMGSGDTYVSSPSPVGNGFRASPVSPTGSTKGMMKSIGGSNTSLASGAPHVIDYKLGDRVIIKSSQGSKVGTVRYIGITDFANGEWVGVELDDPRGKNDGSVNGRRYFECRSNFGLFAPVSKVSKSPSKVKPGACQIHSGGGAGLPPSGIRKTNSKESLFSNKSLLSSMSLTSAASRKTTPKTTTTPIPTRTALQDLLKEKQQHIEQLLKERDLERAEITRAANQAEEAERQLAAVRAEYEKYRSECDATLQEHMNMLNKLKENKNELVAQLDEEKRKNEDLQFRLAETSFSNEDIEKKILTQSVDNENHIKRIKELEEQLAKDRDKIDTLEIDTNKLFEAEENLIRSKEEIESLRKQLQEARSKELLLEGDNVSTAVLIASLQKEVDQHKVDIEERDEMVSVLKHEIARVTSDMKKKLEEVGTQKTELETICNNKDNELSKLKQDLEQVNKHVQDKVTEIEKLANDKLNSEMSLEKEITKLKMEISAKVLDLENFSENTKTKDGDIVNLQSEINSLREQMKIMENDQEQLKEQSIQQIAEKNKLIEDLQINNNKHLQAVATLNEELAKVIQNSETNTNSIRSNLEKILEEKTNESQKFKLELDQMRELTVKQEENYTKLKTEYEEKGKQLECLKVDIERLNNQNTENTSNKNVEIDKLVNSLKEKETLIQSMQSSEENMIKIKNSLERALEEKNSECNNFKLELDQIKGLMIKHEENYTKLKKEHDEKYIQLESLQKEIEKMNNDHLGNINNKNTEMEKLNETLKQKESLIQSLQLELQTTKVDLESVSVNLQQYQTNLNDVETNLKQERDELKESLKTKIVELEEIKKQFFDNMSQHDNQIQEISTILATKSQETDRLLKEMTDLKEQHKSVVDDLNHQHSKQMQEKDEKLIELSNSIENKIKEFNDVSNNAKEIQDKCSEQNSEIEKLREDIENREKENQSVSDTVSKLTEEITQFTKSTQELEVKNSLLETMRIDLENSLKNQKEQLCGKTTELQVSVNNLKQKDEEIVSLQTELSNTKLNLDQVSEDLKKYQSNLNDVEVALAKEKNELQANLKTKTEELEKCKEEMKTKLEQLELELSEANQNSISKVEEIEQLKNQLANVKIDNEKYLREVCDKFKNSYGDMEEKISDLLTTIENKDTIIVNLTTNVNSLNQIVNEKSDSLELLTGELEEARKLHKTGDENSMELQKEIKQLHEEKEKIKEEVTKFKEENEKHLTEKEQFKNEVILLSSQYKELEGKLGNTMKQFEEKENVMKTTKIQYEEKIKMLESATKDLEKSKADLEVDFNKEKAEYEDIIKTAFESEAALKDLVAANNNEDEIKTLQENLDNTKSNLEAREKLLTERNNEISRLREELRTMKLQQQNILNGSENNLPANEAQINQNTDYQQLLEEKLFAENQVAFLNSIIVDMQKKNEEQKARIEILEMGYNASAADELAALGFKPDAKQPTPRMYCDICEEFDLHETEDCPTQGEDDPVINRQLGDKPKEKPPPRPYCDVCGEFGHNTEDCTEDQEF